MKSDILCHQSHGPEKHHACQQSSIYHPCLLLTSSMLLCHRHSGTDDGSTIHATSCNSMCAGVLPPSPLSSPLICRTIQPGHPTATWATASARRPTLPGASRCSRFPPSLARRCVLQGGAGGGVVGSGTGPGVHRLMPAGACSRGGRSCIHSVSCPPQFFSLFNQLGASGTIQVGRNAWQDRSETISPVPCCTPAVHLLYLTFPS